MGKLLELQRVVLVCAGTRNNAGDADMESLDRGRLVVKAVQEELKSCGSRIAKVHSAPQTVARQVAYLYCQEPAVVTALMDIDRDEDGDDLAHAARKVRQHIEIHRACDTLVMVIDNALLEAVLKALLRSHQVSDPPNRSRLLSGEAYFLYLREPVLRIKEMKAPAVVAVEEVRI